MAVNPNMANREVADLVLLDYKTKKVFLPIDFANVTTTDFTANRVFAKGGQGAPNRVGFDGERAVAKIMKREVLTATTDGIELSETPKAGTVQVFAVSDDAGTEISDLTTTDKKVAGAGLQDGKNYIAYYFYDKNDGVQTVKFDSDTFPRAFEIHGMMPFKTEDDEIVQCELVYYKAQPQASFSLAFQNTGDPTTVSITFDCMANQDGDIYDMNFME